VNDVNADMPEHPPATPRQNTSNELRAIALEQFASVGFAGTSLQQIADAAGYSKSSVLYHFASKEALLNDVLTPAIDRLEEILDRFAASTGVNDAASVAARDRFVDEFIDFLLQYRLEVHTFINQGQSLRHIAVVDRAGELIVRLSNTLCDEHASTEDRLRFGVALGGAAYSLVAGMTFFHEKVAPADEIRAALLAVVTELLAPVAVTSQRSGE
jgi:AcrR family transcriptional regulator